MIEGTWSAPVVLVGGGASLKGFDFRRLAALRAHIVGINYAIFDAPCTAGFSIDENFMQRNLDRLIEAATRIDLILAAGGRMQGKVPGATYIGRRFHGRLSEDHDRIYSSGSSGFGALNVAYLKGARLIILLGFDSDYVGAHYAPHEEYPVTAQQHWKLWANSYETTLPQLQARGIEVINASPQSAIAAFPKMTIEEALHVIGCYSKGSAVRLAEKSA